ncbi:hypothetical protein POM88_046729 [Heracleum sosnowskyi]|uniref:Protein kinase domain-containing protein n=1 Tax=Heracleum sosnowskyi TaxID=360622 RepID=A0AAD8H7G5_9APIA|nr:hypothetical protein POM88_046729 [Heracleum sosnowskyi]
MLINGLEAAQVQDLVLQQGHPRRLSSPPDKATESFVFPAMLQLKATEFDFGTVTLSSLKLLDSIGGGLAFVIWPDDDSIGDAGGYIGIMAGTGSPKSVWHITRTRILLGVASALAYLHQECENQVIHRDVKTSNIMLDEAFNAKLGDFGLARQTKHDKSSDAIVAAGTMG